MIGRFVPPASVAMVGGGQLARMTHQAAIALGVELHVLAPGALEPALEAGAHHHLGSHQSYDDLVALAKQCDVITFDHEQVPHELLVAMEAAGHAVRPGAGALRYAQDKSYARRVLGDAGFAVPVHAGAKLADRQTISDFGDAHGWPIIVKAPLGGYDGRGVFELAGIDAFESIPWGDPDAPVLLEERVAIARELAVIVARRPSGDRVTYPVVETVQRHGICHELVFPARIPATTAASATSLAESIADFIGVTGILAVELFLTIDGHLVLNEVATRPHNSGHVTIDASRTSQFENHLRAVLDWPLGSAASLVPAAATVNLLGGRHATAMREALPRALEDPNIKVHLYAKSYSPGRKLGHVTALAGTADEALGAARVAAARLTGP